MANAWPVKREKFKRLDIVEEHHEAHIHMVLLVTVKERRAGMVGREFDLRLGLRIDDRNILHHPGGGYAVALAEGVLVVGDGGVERLQLEGVAMQVDGMVVGA